MANTVLKTSRPKPPRRRRPDDEPEPAWDVARLFPGQGQWSEDEYLALNGNRLVEFSDGRIEVLPMPTTIHQRIVLYLAGLFLAFVKPGKLGEILIAPLRVRLRPGKFREPDLVFMLARHAARIRNEYWEQPDLVIEVVSGEPEDRRRDLVTKRLEYARARIPEYWIVEPNERRITVLRLRGTKYVVHGRFVEGDRAMSVVLKGFEVDVAAMFAAAEEGLT